jgi:hypothetical protein
MTEESNGLIRSLRQQLKEKDAELRTMAEQVQSLASQVEQLAGGGDTAHEDWTDTDETYEGETESEPDPVADQLAEVERLKEEASRAKREAELMTVSNLSASVRSAALGEDSRDLASKIAQAQTPEELARLAAEGGFLQSHSG